MKTTLNTAQDFVIRNRSAFVGVAITAAVAALAIAAQQTGLKQHNDFLKAHDLYDAFYAMPEE